MVRQFVTPRENHSLWLLNEAQDLATSALDRICAAEDRLASNLDVERAVFALVLVSEKLSAIWRVGSDDSSRQEHRRSSPKCAATDEHLMVQGL